jgi:hypothetical protein
MMEIPCLGAKGQTVSGAAPTRQALPRYCQPLDVWPFIGQHIGSSKKRDNVKLCQL